MAGLCCDLKIEKSELRPIVQVLTDKFRLTRLTKNSFVAQRTKAEEPWSGCAAEASSAGVTGIGGANGPLAESPRETRGTVAEPRPTSLVLGT